LPKAHHEQTRGGHSPPVVNLPKITRKRRPAAFDTARAELACRSTYRYGHDDVSHLSGLCLFPLKIVYANNDDAHHGNS
jgi:hypothetical protein